MHLTTTRTGEDGASVGASSALELSVVIPCLNEAEGIAVVVEKALRTMDHEGIAGEVVVVDNGSTDDSASIAEEAGARVVHESRRGYGSAYQAGFATARVSTSLWATAMTPTTSPRSIASSCRFAKEPIW